MDRHNIVSNGLVPAPEKERPKSLREKLRKLKLGGSSVSKLFRCVGGSLFQSSSPPHNFKGTIQATLHTCVLGTFLCPSIGYRTLALIQCVRALANNECKSRPLNRAPPVLTGCSNRRVTTGYYVRFPWGTLCLLYRSQKCASEHPDI